MHYGLVFQLQFAEIVDIQYKKIDFILPAMHLVS